MKTVNYELIVSDFDGTLASSDGTVSEKNKKAIFEYIDAGGKIAVSTGDFLLQYCRRFESLG